MLLSWLAACIEHNTSAQSAVAVSGAAIQSDEVTMAKLNRSPIHAGQIMSDLEFLIPTGDLRVSDCLYAGWV